MTGSSVSIYQGAMEAKYLFVDGGFLRELSNKFSEYFFDGSRIELDYSLIKGNHTKAFYYDALPKRRNKEKEDAFKARLSLSLIHI